MRLPCVFALPTDGIVDELRYKLCFEPPDSTELQLPSQPRHVTYHSPFAGQIPRLSLSANVHFLATTPVTNSREPGPSTFFFVWFVWRSDRLTLPNLLPKTTITTSRPLHRALSLLTTTTRPAPHLPPGPAARPREFPSSSFHSHFSSSSGCFLLLFFPSLFLWLLDPLAFV